MLQAQSQQREAVHFLRSEWRIRVMSDKRYDVIIIGTGAGGGTMAYHLAPTGKKILILSAATMFRVRKRIGIRKSSMSTVTTTPRNRGSTRTARICIRTRTTTLEATRSFTVPPSFACARKTSANCGIMAEFRLPGQLATTNSSRTTRKLKTFITFMAIVARILPNRQPTRHIRGRQSATNRVSSNSPMIRPLRLETIPRARRRDAR